MSLGEDFDSLKGRGIFLTGGATGIGAAMVEAFAIAGASVWFNDIDTKNGSALADRLGSPVTFVAADATDASALKSCIDSAAAAMGRLDVLVNNVANDLREDFAEITPDSWRRMLSINLDPVVFASQASLPYLKAASSGSIINFSSLNALIGPADLPTYTAAKAAIIGLTKSLANEYGKDGIRANAIVPGWVVTEKQRKLWLTPEADEAWKTQCALKSDILPSDVANLALFLASDASRMITSQSLVIDAGRT